METIIGKVGQTTAGEWNALNTYEYLDVVVFEGSSYLSKKAQNNSLITDQTAWQINAEKGLKGDKGDTFAFDDLTTEEKQELKGDVVAYNTLTDADKQNLAGYIPVTGLVEKDDTKAVSGGEVYAKTVSPTSVGIENYSALDNIFKYSDFTDKDKFQQNKAITGIGNVANVNNWNLVTMPIKQGLHKTNLYLTASVAIITYDRYGNIVTSYSSKGNVAGTLQWEFTTDASEIEVKISIHNNQLTKGQANSIFITAGSDYTLTTDDVFELKKNYKSNPFIGVCLGESTTMFGNYPQIVGENIGMKIYNCGVGGTTFTKTNNSDLNMLTFTPIADAINNGDFSLVNTALDNLISSSTGTERLRYTAMKENINAVVWSDVRFLAVWYGQNDFASSRTLGAEDLNTMDITTISGAMNYGISKIQSVYPNIKIVFISPTHRFMNNDLSSASDSDTFTNVLGKKLIEYNDFIINQANRNHYPCKDMYRQSGFNKFNHTTYFGDSVHPNDKGYKMCADIITGFIKSQYNF